MPSDSNLQLSSYEPGKFVLRQRMLRAAGSCVCPNIGKSRANQQWFFDCKPISDETPNRRILWVILTKTSIQRGEKRRKTMPKDQRIQDIINIPTRNKKTAPLLPATLWSHACPAQTTPADHRKSTREYFRATQLTHDRYSVRENNQTPCPEETRTCSMQSDRS